MSSDERIKIERAVAERRAGDSDFIIAGVLMLIAAGFVVGVAVGWFSATWWLP